MTQSYQNMDSEDYIGSFNNNDLEEIAKLKQLAKDFIDQIDMLGNTDERRKGMACDHIEIATMLAVKSIFTKS